MKRLAIILAILIPSILMAQLPKDSLTLECKDLRIIHKNTWDKENHFHTSYRIFIYEGVVLIKESGHPNFDSEYGELGSILHRSEWDKYHWEPMNASYSNSWVKRFPILIQKDQFEEDPSMGYTFYAAPFIDPERKNVEVAFAESKSGPTLFVEYEDKIFAFHCEYTDERFIDLNPANDTLTPYNLIESGNKYNHFPEYTDEYLIKEFDKYGNGEAIVNMIKVSFYTGQELEF